MLRRITMFVFVFGLFSSVLGQFPEKFNYQAVLRDDAGQEMVLEDVSVKLSILKGDMDGPQVFTETHEVTTNEFGLVTLVVGSINPLSDVNFSADSYFVEIRVNGHLMGVSQLASVPYALHSQTSDDTFSGDYEDLLNVPDLTSFIEIEDPESGDMLYFTEEGWESLPVGDEGQILSVVDGMPAWIDDPPTTVTDVEGNVYQTVVIGNQEWMAENLRTSKYRDGTDIPGGLSNADWQSQDEGAYALYPHNNVDGIDSEQEMIEAYGKLYNWYAVDDSKGLCPEGWYVPTDSDWTQLVDYLLDNVDDIDTDNVGNVLKSCRQVDSPLGGDCDTADHPRWNSHGTHYGTDDFGFSAFPAGRRRPDGSFAFIVGMTGFWWSSSEYSSEDTYWIRDLRHTTGGVTRNDFEAINGFSVRCVRESQN